MSSALFVSGTDTGCGKTAVGCAAARGLRAAGQRVRVLKPVETGCERRDGEAIALDALALAEAAGDPSPADRLCPYRLELPAAPQVAAREQAVQLELAPIAAALAAARREADVVIVEGAGGLLVPLTAELDMASLALRLQLPVLLVARAALGTLNHTLLSLEAAAARGLAVLGVVISHTHPDLTYAESRNLELLRERLPVPLLAELPHGARRLDPEPDWETLLAAAGKA